MVRPAFFLPVTSCPRPATSHSYSRWAVITPARRRRLPIAHSQSHSPKLTGSQPIALLIKLVDIHKSFGPKKVLQGFSLEIAEEESMVVIGYSGSGKSVAIKHIVGLLEPDAGEVWVDGREVPRLSRRDLWYPHLPR